MAAASNGIDEVYSELLPADKVEKVEALMAKRGSRKKSWLLSATASTMRRYFPGADIGIAMGAHGFGCRH